MDNAPNRINLNGHYTTTEGLPVIILSTTHEGPYPVKGAVCMIHLPGNPLEEAWWTSTGKSQTGGYDLVEVPLDPFCHLPTREEPPIGELEKDDPNEYAELNSFVKDAVCGVIAVLVSFFFLGGVFVLLKIIFEND